MQRERNRPPATLPGTPTKVTLSAGTTLYRVHNRTRSSIAFNPKPVHPLYGGGRFDATELDAYPFLYAGLTSTAAICESLLRSIPFPSDGGERLLLRAVVAGRRLSTVRLATDVTLVSLVSGADLAAVGQDAWLVQAEAAEYPYTRDWCHFIRRHTQPWAQGLIWLSKREPADRAAVLFGDRGAGKALEETDLPPIDFDTPEGEEWLNDALAPYLTRLGP